jgi:uncharacterized membrane protein YeiH
MDTLILVLEIAATIAFAISGAMTGLKKNMDMFGVVILGLTTAVGGGILRDIILGITPPKAFQNPMYALIAIFTSIILLFPTVRKWLMHNNRFFERVLFIMDTLGLGIFTVMGICIANEVSSSFNGFLLIFVGVITGVGGGVLRDILAGNTPYIFIKHIYACASLIGAIVCYAMWNFTGNTYAMLAGAIIVIIIRCLSAHFNLNLPCAKDID